MATPDYNSYINEAWGWPDEDGDADDSSDYLFFLTANNLVVGTNPVYTAADFLAFYPNFGGLPLPFSSITSTPGSAVLTGFTSITGIQPGQLIAGPFIPDGATVASTAGSSPNFTVTLNTPVLASAGGTGTVAIYNALLIPLSVINAYVYIASNSLFQARWGELWTFAMALYVAHFCTLWLMGQSAPAGSSAAVVASAGLALAIKTSKSVQDVSIGGTPLMDLEGWGTYQLTIYGQQLATFAKTVGSGNMLIW